MRTAVSALVLGAVAALVFAVSALGSGSARSVGAVVKTSSTGLGTILVDARGRTLYLFEHDKGAMSSCYGKCATNWPPLLTAARPTAGAGARAGLLGTTRRKDGRLQVTYAKHPLYLFVADRSAGATKGEGIDAFGGEWYAVSPKGTKVEEESSSSSSSGGGGGYGSGYGYGYRN